MGRRSKVSYEDKVRACEDYLEGTYTVSQILERLGMSFNSNTYFYRWVKMYQEHGPESLMPKLKNSSYTKDFKTKVVEEYLSGSGSFIDLCVKYKIPSTETLKSWIMRYHDCKELKDYLPKSEVYTNMAKRNTTQSEREEIVKYCIDHKKDYKHTAAVYDVSYAQVYSWVKKYLEKGIDGLSDKRGKRKEESELTELEQSQRKIKILEAKIRELEMEQILLKKVQEIERRRSSRGQGKK